MLHVNALLHSMLQVMNPNEQECRCYCRATVRSFSRWFLGLCLASRGVSKSVFSDFTTAADCEGWLLSYELKACPQLSYAAERGDLLAVIRQSLCPCGDGVVVNEETVCQPHLASYYLLQLFHGCCFHREAKDAGPWMLHCARVLQWVNQPHHRWSCVFHPPRWGCLELNTSAKWTLRLLV